MKHRGRPLHGILLLDKPLGLSSNRALQQLRRALGAAKAGHTGALDPLATGMLPLCFGRATRLAGLLLDSDKAYRTTATLGRATSTGDAEGEEVMTRPLPALDPATIEQVLARFRGDIEQVPPMYSALKHQGRTLYSLARQGIEVQRPARRVRIHALRCLGYDRQHLQLEVVCSKGTYIRTLVEDIGLALGSCAFVSALRRLWVAPFQDQPMHTLEALLAQDGAQLEALLQPIDYGLRHLPRIQLDAADSEHLRHGRALQRTQPADSTAVRPEGAPGAGPGAESDAGPGAGPGAGLLRIDDAQGRLLAVGEWIEGRLHVRTRLDAAG